MYMHPPVGELNVEAYFPTNHYKHGRLFYADSHSSKDRVPVVVIPGPATGKRNLVFHTL